jgi:hypothetical protein
VLPENQGTFTSLFSGSFSDDSGSLQKAPAVVETDCVSLLKALMTGVSGNFGFVESIDFLVCIDINSREYNIQNMVHSFFFSYL